MSTLTIVALVAAVAVGVVLIRSKSSSSGTNLSAANAGIIISATTGKFAGAVSSITFAGKEFVNSKDAGRLFQTAMQVDGWGECNNPTEAGASSDGDTSTSVLKAHAQVSANNFATSTQAAYFLSKFRTAAFCPKGADPRVVSPLSTTTIDKNILLGQTIGGVDYPDVFRWMVGIHSPDAVEKLDIEILTGYLNSEFNRAFSVSPSGELTETTRWDAIDILGGGQSVNTFAGVPLDTAWPIIFTTSDATHALGVYRRRSSVRLGEAAAYGVIKFADCVKFSVVSHAPISIQTNTPAFAIYGAVGTLAVVHQRIAMLIRELP